MLEQATAPKTIRLLPKQDRFVFSDAKYTGFIAGLGSGKTFAGCIKALLKSQIWPGQDGMVISPTYTMLRDVTQKTFLQLLDAGGWAYDFNRSENSVVFNGSQILFRSADAPERLRGVNLNWCYIDEAAQVAEDVWRIVLGRLRAGSRPQAWITTTPAGYNWVYKYWVEKGDPQYRLIHSSTRENTYLPTEYLRDLIDNYVGEFAKQEIDGEFVAFEGLVYPEFSRNIHIYKDEPLPSSWARVRGIDFGYTNPFVCLFGALDHDGRLYIYDEHYRAKALLKEHAAAINSRNGGGYLWSVADHDAQGVAELAELGIPTVAGRKDIEEGLQRVKARLVVKEDGYPRLFISSRCVNTIREISMYRWQESKAGRNDKEEPLKENDHAMDALRYMVMMADAGVTRVWDLAASALGL